MYTCLLFKHLNRTSFSLTFVLIGFRTYSFFWMMITRFQNVNFTIWYYLLLVLSIEINIWKIFILFFFCHFYFRQYIVSLVLRVIFLSSYTLKSKNWGSIILVTFFQSTPTWDFSTIDSFKTPFITDNKHLFGVTNRSAFNNNSVQINQNFSQ